MNLVWARATDEPIMPKTVCFVPETKEVLVFSLVNKYMYVDILSLRHRKNSAVLTACALNPSEATSSGRRRRALKSCALRFCYFMLQEFEHTSCQGVCRCRSRPESICHLGREELPPVQSQRANLGSYPESKRTSRLLRKARGLR